MCAACFDLDKARWTPRKYTLTDVEKAELRAAAREYKQRKKIEGDGELSFETYVQRTHLPLYRAIGVDETIFDGNKENQKQQENVRRGWDAMLRRWCKTYRESEKQEEKSECPSTNDSDDGETSAVRHSVDSK